MLSSRNAAVQQPHSNVMLCNVLVTAMQRLSRGDDALAGRLSAQPDAAALAGLDDAGQRTGAVAGELLRAIGIACDAAVQHKLRHGADAGIKVLHHRQRVLDTLAVVLVQVHHCTATL